MTENEHQVEGGAHGSFAESLGELILQLAEHFNSQPGFMWSTSGLEVLHADWPAYPRGHGVRWALETLSQFPTETVFDVEDRIDECTLFVVRRGTRDARTAIHLAVWDEDLRACAVRRWLAGISEHGPAIEFSTNSIYLTSDGAHAALVQELTRNVNRELLAEVEEYLYATRYDTAVREAALRVEIELRALASNDQLRGQRLVDHCFQPGAPFDRAGLTNAQRVNLQNMFRAYFTFVRNEYAHNLPGTDVLMACRLVARAGELVSVIRSLAGVPGEVGGDRR